MFKYILNRYNQPCRYVDFRAGFVWRAVSNTRRGQLNTTPGFPGPRSSVLNRTQQYGPLLAQHPPTRSSTPLWKQNSKSKAKAPPASASELVYGTSIAYALLLLLWLLQELHRFSRSPVLSSSFLLQQYSSTAAAVVSCARRQQQGYADGDAPTVSPIRVRSIVRDFGACAPEVRLLRVAHVCGAQSRRCGPGIETDNS